MKTREQLNTDILIAIHGALTLNNLINLNISKSKMRKSDLDEILNSVSEQAKCLTRYKKQSIEIDEAERG